LRVGGELVVRTVGDLGTKGRFTAGSRFFAGVDAMILDRKKPHEPKGITIES